MKDRHFSFGIFSLTVTVIVFGLAFLSQGKKGVNSMDTNGKKEIKIYDSREKGVVKVKKVTKTDAEWQTQLGAETYRVTRRGGTERPFTGRYTNHKEQGTYHCVACGSELFPSATKFDSHCGWPSFYAPVSDYNVSYRRDDSLAFQQRTEILCPRCDAHLGHVFTDGPTPTGLRYCVNSASLAFEPAGNGEGAAGEERQSGEQVKKGETAAAYFAAGCFWGVEAAFRQIKGVKETAAGYMGGHDKDPTYKEVCTGSTGHAETVMVVYDPAKVSYEKLLTVFWENHNPTTLNRQGPDVGNQYRSAVFYTSEEQKLAALAYRVKLEIARKYDKPIVTEIAPAGVFYRAEEYHQRYLEKRGLSTCHM